jgi:hypothetical protein
MFRSKEHVLSTRAIKRLHEHLAGCNACAEAQDWDQAIASVFKGEAALKTPTGFNSAVWRKIAKDIVPAPFRWRLLPAAAGVLCVAAAALGLVLITYHSIHIIPDTQTGITTRAVTSLGTHQVEISPSILPGGKNKSPETIGAEYKTTVITESSPVLKSQRWKEIDGRTMPREPRQVWQASSEESGDLVSEGAVKQRVKVPVVTRRSATKRLAAGSAAPVKTLSRTPIPAGIRLLKNKINLNRAEQARWELALDQPGRVSVKVFSREGKLVKNILENNLLSGHYVFEWDGTSESGEKVASGIYLLVVRGVLGEQRFKLVVIK